MKSTQSDKNLDFNGMAGDGVNRAGNRFAKNQYTGHSNDGREVNFGRGPTKGNQDYNAGQGAHREPPTRALPGNLKTKNVDAINGGAQFRGYGSKEVKKPTNIDKIDFSRGPTKGNQQ